MYLEGKETSQLRARIESLRKKGEGRGSQCGDRGPGGPVWTAGCRGGKRPGISGRR